MHAEMQTTVTGTILGGISVIDGAMIPIETVMKTSPDERERIVNAQDHETDHTTADVHDPRLPRGEGNLEAPPGLQGQAGDLELRSLLRMSHSAVPKM